MSLPGLKTPGTLLENLTEKVLHSVWPSLDLFLMDPFIKQNGAFCLLAVSLSGRQCFSLECLGNASPGV